MPEQLLTILNICLLVLLYLFLLRVVRAVWAEVQEPVTTTSAEPTQRGRVEAPKPARGARRRRGLHEMVVREPAELAGRTHPLSAEMTLGRAPGCTIVVDDQFVSSVHTRIFQRDSPGPGDRRHR